MLMCCVLEQETTPCQCVVSSSKRHYPPANVLCHQTRDIISMSMCCVLEQETSPCQCVVSSSKKHYLHVNVLCP